MRPTICPRVSLTRFISPVFSVLLKWGQWMCPRDSRSRNYSTLPLFHPFTIPTDQKPVSKCAAQHFRYRNMTSRGVVGLRVVYLKIVFGSWILKLWPNHNFCHQTPWGDMGRGPVALTTIRGHIHILPQQQMHIGFECFTLFNFVHSDSVVLRP